MLVKTGAIVGLGVAVLALAACGSASYSVGEVESAFAAHGIPLARDQPQHETRGVVELANFSDGVVVLVSSGGVGGYFFQFAGALAVRLPSPLKQGDLTVYATPEYARAVRAALRQLRH